MTFLATMALCINEDFVKPCPEDEQGIFCDQDILRKVQFSGIYKDSKTFVDMPLKVNVKNVSMVKNDILNATNKYELEIVLQRYFDSPGYREIFQGNITDYSEQFALLEKIKNAKYKDWAKKLCSKWENLARKQNESVHENSNHHSLIYLNETMIVPGGRFREMYYWDTYWVIDGLCLCEMYETAKDVLKNLLHFVKEYGFIPNGGRKYYLNRSQPPMLTLMMNVYMEYSKDEKFVKDNMELLIKEYEFWLENRNINITVGNKTHKVVRYNCLLGFPRPESFKEDVETMLKTGFQNDPDKAKILYSHIASAAESGWDFSSRWFQDKSTLETIQTRHIIPLDLNCIFYKVESVLATFYKKLLKDEKNSERMEVNANERLKSIDELFWNDDVKMWLDYNIVENKHATEYYVSAFFPFWIFPQSAEMQVKFEQAFTKMKDLKIFDYPGGLPTSLINSGQQWDFPNAWPPLQYVAVHGLRKGNEEMQNSAKELAAKYLDTAYTIWDSTGHMFEKYDVTKRGKAGHGGEYDVQEGFGWTNGIALNFLSNYGDLVPSKKN